MVMVTFTTFTTMCCLGNKVPLHGVMIRNNSLWSDERFSIKLHVEQLQIICSRNKVAAARYGSSLR